VTGTDPVAVSNPLRSLKPNTTYYFSVGAFSSAGTVAGDTLTFTTDYAVAAPILGSPEDGSVDQPIPTLFVWYRSAGATAYWLQVSQDSLFSTVAFQDTSAADTSRQVSSLLRGTTYFWRVQPVVRRPPFQDYSAHPRGAPALFTLGQSFGATAHIDSCLAKIPGSRLIPSAGFRIGYFFERVLRFLGGHRLCGDYPQSRQQYYLFLEGTCFECRGHKPVVERMEVYNL